METKQRSETDALIEGITISGTYAEYRDRQLAALDKFANNLESERDRLRAALESLLAQCDGPSLGTTAAPTWRAVCDARAALLKAGE